MLKRFLLGLIEIYRLIFSSLVGQTCRFAPSCSDYAREAITRHGAWAGLWLTVKRLSRCHPWGGHGFDPVPDTLDHRRSSMEKPGR